MPSDGGSDYQVGYGKPPTHTRFKKGESGNPKGRPKGSKNVATLLEKELKQRVVVTENGRRRSITKQEAMLKHLVNKAVSGDRRLIQLLLDEMRLLETRAALSTSGKEVLAEADREVMRQLQERMRRLIQEGGKDESKTGPDAS
jgi:Family of unknown function (DUF5681)